MDFLSDFRTSTNNRMGAATPATPVDRPSWSPSEETVLRSTPTPVAPQHPETQVPSQPAAPAVRTEQHRFQARASGAPPEPPAEQPRFEAPAAWSPPTEAPFVAPASWAPPGQAPGLAAPEHVFSYPRAGRRTVRRVLSALVILAIVVAAGGLAKGKIMSKSHGYPSKWDPRVAAIATFVQNARGLKWKHPVNVEFLAPAQFVKKIGGNDTATGSRQTDEQQLVRVMRAFGLVSGNVDLGKASSQLTGNEVVGLYVPADKTVFVKGDQLTPFVRTTLAHELTHALQDQYYDLTAMRQGSADDDQAVTALIEGDAVRIEGEYDKTLTPLQRKSLLQEDQQGLSMATGQNAAEHIPQFLVDQAQFPYDFGPTFVEALFHAGGNKAVDAAFANPPTLDSQIVDPVSFSAGAPTPKISAPALQAGERRLLPTSGFGEVPLFEALAAEIGFNAAWSAVQGWTSDQFVAYQQGSATCAALTVRDDNSADTATLVSAGSRWAKRIRGASVTNQGNDVYFRSCDPGPAWRPGLKGSDPYQDLATRAFWLGAFVADANANVVTAGCIADQLMTSVGPQKLRVAAESTDVNASVQQLRIAAGVAAASCGMGASDQGN